MVYRAVIVNLLTCFMLLSFLSCLCAGLVFGLPHVLLPSRNMEIDFETGDCTNLFRNQQCTPSVELHRADSHQSSISRISLFAELSCAVFSCLTSILQEKGSGLLCLSSVDLDTRTGISVPCLYLILPSYKQDTLLIKVRAFVRQA